MADFIAWHGRTLDQHVALRDEWAKKGYRFLSLSVYGPVTAPIYAAVMIRRPIVVAQRDWPSLTAAQWQQTFNEQAAQDFGPVILAATGSASDPRFAAVFPAEPDPSHAAWADVGRYLRSEQHRGHERCSEGPGSHPSLVRLLREYRGSTLRCDLGS